MAEGPADAGAAVDLGLGESRVFRRLIPTLGVLLLVGAGLKSVHTLATSDILLEAVLDFFLIGSLGMLLLFVGFWLPTTGIRPEFYPRIGLWTVGGVGAMGLVFALRVLHPGVTVDFAFGTQAVLLAIGSAAGLGIGVHEAQARIHARRLEDRNEALQRAEQKLDATVTELEASKAELETSKVELEASKAELETSKAELEASNDELEASKAELEASNEELEASNEQLEQFAYAASHDLREPLRMVNSYLQLLENRYGDALDEDGEEFLDFARDGAQRMNAMIDSLLEYSRVETQGASFDAVDLNDVLDDVLTDLQVAIEESDATITREPLPTVECDEQQLRQVFQNLVSNAIQYSGEEPPRIHVSAEHEGPDWKLQVHDDGPGIDSADADRIFDVFERLHSTEEQSGSGIGLALCERIVDRHDGRIWVEPGSGGGATFSLTLPARDAPDEVHGPVAPPAAAERVVGSGDGRRRAPPRPHQH